MCCVLTSDYMEDMATFTALLKCYSIMIIAYSRVLASCSLGAIGILLLDLEL